MKKLLKYISLTIILIVFGFLISSKFLNLSLSLMDLGNMQIMSTTIGSQFHQQLMFALALGLIPVLYAIVERITGMKFLNQGLISIVLILCFGILTWQFRIFQINTRLKEFSDFSLGDDGIHNSIDIRTLDTEIYLLVGLIVGAFISAFLFKKKTKMN